jgi:hypothetical protein
MFLSHVDVLLVRMAAAQAGRIVALSPRNIELSNLIEINRLAVFLERFPLHDRLLDRRSAPKHRDHGRREFLDAG